ncbi:MAG: polysaccharide deacetylase family protein [Syntrophobacteria bacterium]
MTSGKNSASLWQHIPADIHRRLHHCLDQVVTELSHGDGSIVFFRADDVAVPGRKLARLVDIFGKHQVPLTLAVVPAWLTETRWRRLLELCSKDHSLWCWMQHGWRHLNHEPQGSKLEFGPSRSFSLKRKDLQTGFRRLNRLMGDAFTPAFTPPWNRCDSETLNALQELSYQALSRNLGAQPPAPAALTEYPVSVDLHTRKEKDGESGWQNFFKELRESLGNGFCGIMIHHQRMNNAAFDFLELLLSELKQRNFARLVHVGTLLREGYLKEKAEW